MDNDWEILLDAVGFEPAGMGVIVGRTGLESGAIASILLGGQRDGRVQQQPRGRFCRRQPGKV